MKKRTIRFAICALICIVSAATLLTACSNGEETPEPAGKTFTVTFVTNGGSAIAPKQAEKGQTLRDVLNGETSVLEGKVLEAWYTDAAFTEEFSLYTPVYSDLTLYAKWRLPNESERLELAAIKTKSEATFTDDRSRGESELHVRASFADGILTDGYAKQNADERFIFENNFYYLDEAQAKAKTPSGGANTGAAFLYDAERFEERNFYQTFAPIALGCADESDFTFSADSEDENKIRVTYTGSFPELSMTVADTDVELCFSHGKTFDFVLENGRIASFRQSDGNAYREVTFDYDDETPAIERPDAPESYNMVYQVTVYDCTEEESKLQGWRFYASVTKAQVGSFLGLRWGYDRIVYADESLTTLAAFDGDTPVALTAHVTYYCVEQKGTDASSVAWRAIDQFRTFGTMKATQYDRNGQITGSDCAVNFDEAQQAANGGISNLYYSDYVAPKADFDAAEAWYCVNSRRTSSTIIIRAGAAVSERSAMEAVKTRRSPHPTTIFWANRLRLKAEFIFANSTITIVETKFTVTGFP